MTVIMYLSVFLCALQSLCASSWSSPVELDGTWSENAAIAIDAKGNAVAVWSHFDEESVVIKSCIKGAGSKWLAPIVLSDTAPVSTKSDLSSPWVQFDPQGNCYASWVSSEEGRDVIHISLLPAGKTSWVQAPPIASSHTNVWGFQLTFDAAGNGFALWNSYDTDIDFFESARLPFEAKAWEPIEPMQLESQIQSLSLALDALGNATLVWIEQRDGNFPNTILSSELGKQADSWTTPQIVISKPDDFALTAQVVVDANSNALILAYFEFADAAIVGAIRPTGNTAWETMHTPKEFGWSELTMNQDQVPFLIWTDRHADSPLRCATFSFETKSWSKPVDVIPNKTSIGKNFSKFKGIRFAQSGNAICVWSHDEDEYHSTLYASRLTQNGWQTPEHMATIHSIETMLHGWPALAFSPDDTFHFIYCDDFYPSYSVKAVMGTNLFTKTSKGVKK